MTCPFSFLFFFVLLSLCVCLCRPVRLTDANTPKKCRALFGLDQLSLWCKPCRYYCCRTNGRKTSTKITFFSLIITHCASETQFRPCGNRWQTLLRCFPHWGTSCYKFPLSNFPRISWSKPSGRKWISKWYDQIFDCKQKPGWDFPMSFWNTLCTRLTGRNPFSSQAVAESLPS